MKKAGRKINKPNCCILCSSDEDNEIEYGEMLSKEGISVHHYCLVRIIVCNNQF